MNIKNRKIHYICAIVLLVLFTVLCHPVLASNSVTVSGEILPANGLVAAFSGTPVTGTAPLLVRFTDQSTGRITSRAWDFTNDGRTDSAARNPTYRYTQPGNYSVRLTVTGPGGSDAEVKRDYIRVLPSIIPPVARYSRDRWIGQPPLTVTFTDHSLNNPTVYMWSFGDGTSSREKNPVHTYQKAGVYVVRLMVSNWAGTDTQSGVVMVLGRWF